jgi:hypothetical protein
METNHINEWQIQEFIFETAPIPELLSAHLNECAICWDKINEYTAVSKVLSRSEKIVLDECLKNSLLAEITAINKNAKFSFRYLFAQIAGRGNKGKN